MKWKLPLIFTLMLVGCTHSTTPTINSDPNLLLHLGFDENQGTTVHDLNNKVPDTTLNYVFNKPVFMDTPIEPSWTNSGIKDGSVLFDGYSNYIRYNYSDIALKGDQLTLSVWLAPRNFESVSGEYTGVISQYVSSINAGVFLGYGDFGYPQVRFGLDDRIIFVDGNTPLKKYEWNYLVAVFNGKRGEAYLYLNGNEVGSKRFFEDATIHPAFDEHLFIGKNSEGKSNATASLNFHSGLIDELKIYKTVLTSETILQTYQNTQINSIPFDDIWLKNILQTDIYKTQYHGGPYQHWMNEPHSPMYYKGYYHLFFQFNLHGPYFANIAWGHLVSDDMVNWIPKKEIISPTEGTVAPNGVWSGASTLDSHGNPVILFTAGNYNKGSMISSQNIGVARPKDLNDPFLTEWTVDDTLAVIQTSEMGRGGEFRDPSIFYEDGVWYMTVCSASSIPNTGGTALLFKTTDDSFHNWQYTGQLYEMVNQSLDLGQTWELPILLPIWNDSHTIKKYVFIISPAPANKADNDVFYFVGNFNKMTNRFVPDADFANPKLFDYGNNVFTGPSGFVDPTNGKAFVFSIMQDQRVPSDVYTAGWANGVGLAREIYLSEDGKDCYIRASENIKGLEQTVLLDKTNLTLESANEQLNNVQGDMLHIEVEYDSINSSNFGIKFRKSSIGLEETAIYYNTLNSTVGIKTGLSGALGRYQNITGNFFGQLPIGSTLKMDIYLDRSLVEAFIDGKKALSARIYPDKTSLGIGLFADTGTIHITSLKISKMGSIF
jgi:sucrose-6-phosphate hydrolase SacC (GH32 family)